MTPAAAGTALARDLRDAVDGVTVEDGGEIVVAGRRLRGDLDRAELATALYAWWFCGLVDGDGLVVPAGDDPWLCADLPTDEIAGGSRDLTESLRAAHAGSRSFSGGWRAERVSSTGRVVAVRDGEHRLLGSADHVNLSRPGLLPQAGDDVAAVDRRDSTETAPGFWLAAGPAWAGDGARPPLVRVYWNVAADAAPGLVEALTGALGGGPGAWALKLPVDAAQLGRRDAAVAYLPRDDFERFAPALATATARAARPAGDAPPLTLRLAPGVGLAEDPPGDESFGSSRCALVADGLANGVREGARTPDELLDAVSARFEAAGIDPRRPYLDAGSEREYAWPSPARRRVPALPVRALRTAGRRSPSTADAAPETLREEALAIARQLAGSALRHEDRCTWVGDALEPIGGSWTVVTRSCGADLYSGTAGVGRFLAHAAAAGEDGVAGTARAAFRHALRTAARAPLQRGGLFLGAAGTTWAALEAARVLDDAALRDDAAALAADAADAVAREPADDDDLLNGEAGAIVALLAVERELGAEARGRRVLAAARAAGERLLAAATRSGLGWHWPARTGVSPYGLCGLAHGASGIALAFLALQARTGAARYGDAARAALAYERRWFRDGKGWPDLRDATGADLAAGRGIAYPALWCHGAAGVALVRLAAYAGTGRPEHLAEAGAGIHAARAEAARALRALAERPDDPGDAANWSLCHGLLGSAELMLCAGAVLGPPEHLAAARRLGRHALADRAAHGSWRCGVPGGGETPGLMLGLAGIGTTLLRLHDLAAAPPPVLPGIPLTPA